LSVASDAKAKRAAFSEVYQDAFGRAVVMANLDEKKDLMLQGTLRPDLIETAAKRVSGVARQIKQHHNVFDRFEKLEPNQHLHKDQVRRIASALGLPDELAYRQPFPGPGLFVRTICGATPTIDGNYDKATAELKQYASAHHLDALVLPIKTVGIKGDDRSYDYAAVLAGQEEWETLATHADRIPRVIHGINRVLYAFQRDLGGLDPQMLITPTFCRREELDLLREADHIVNKHQERAGMDSRQIEQFPVNLLPVHLGKRGTRTIVLRPFVTVDFYTGLPAIPAAKVENNEQIDGNLVVAMANDIRNIDGIGAVLYDLTSKPPGTTELE
ncbi:MAG TPA: hypothetical protein VLJ21_02370, partial [Candidatus Binatia bacterium]|nr:hypothetical protein [Candidatus Binatia bacterium]